MIAFTICANNYLAYALNLSHSFKAHHPDLPFCILLVDTPSEEINYQELDVDRIMWVGDMDFDLEDLSARYNIAELCTVVKPLVIASLFEQGFDQVLYLDPDIQVYSPFEEVLTLLSHNDMIVTPHICSPTPDGVIPQDHTLMRTGVYNMGFAGFNKTSCMKDFLGWWNQRVQRHGYHDVPRGYFFDQIWIMWAPCFLERLHVLRHLGYNAANWNLHERSFLSTTNGGYLINNEWPLRFFHFSHFKPEKYPELASYNRTFNADNRKDIAGLFQDYMAKLTQFGHSKFENIPFTYGNTFIDDAERGKLQAEIQSKRSGRFQRAFYHLKRVLSIMFRG